MKELGQRLRACRERCAPGPDGRRLSLERMAELVGLKLGNESFSFQTLSNWERGQTRIPERRRLLAAIEVLREQGGLRQPEEADRLLGLAQFSPLDAHERRRLFAGAAHGSARRPGSARRHAAWFVLGEGIGLPSHELRHRLNRAAGDGSSGAPQLVLGVAGGRGGRC